jgi:predicted transcriptional regulator YdeE
MRIWTMRELKRSFVADFEVHDQRAADPGNTVVDIYVGVK